MRQDARLPMMVHALLHMARVDVALTSEELAPRMNMHPVVMRRAMAGLRRARIVRAQKGHGGGFLLARALDAITLEDVYAALGITRLFAVGRRTEHPTCLVEKAVNRTIDEALARSQELFHERLRRVTLADLQKELPSKHRHMCPERSTGRRAKGVAHV
jgi:Rrf2 family protein